MVSTRGVKFKFSEGEKVLCYEPDPTKAKVLYDSKVLKLVVSHDSRGRKVPEYLIHFFGWNNSWNRCVVEGFILPDNEENRNLQRKLAEDAALQLKGKSKRKLPPIIKETLSKKECTQSKKDMDNLRQIESPEYQSESESEDDVEKVAEIEISQPLKEQLEEDCYYITKKNKVVKLPCEPNVISILESYVKHLAANLLCAAPPKNSKARNEPFIPEDVESKLDFCKEVMDGVRIFFDFTLPHLLLYQQEQKHYYTVGTICRPICGAKRECQKNQDETTAADTKVGAVTSDNGSQSEQNTSKECISSAATVPASIRGRPSLRNSSQISKSELLNEESLTNGSAGSILPTKNKISNRSQLSKAERRERASGTKRVLRSNDKQKGENSSAAVADSSKRNSSESESCLPTRPESPALSSSPSCYGRGTPKNVSCDASQSTTSNSSDIQSSSVLQSQCPVSSSNAAVPTVISSSNQSINPLPPLNLSVTNSICSSASSTRSSLSSPRFHFQAFQPLNASGMLSEILSWNMLPSYVYEQVPAPASLIYGAQHLLRLFVKLPDLIYKMNIPKKKLIPLMNNLADFLKYLSERREEIFLPSAYVDVNETCGTEQMYS